MSARIDGLQDVTAKLKKMGADTRERVQREVKRAALNVQNSAKLAAPVDTGRLRNSITHAMDGDELGAQIGTNVEYAASVEFGSSRSRAQPYLVPALEQERGPFQARVAQALRDSGRAG